MSHHIKIQPLFLCCHLEAHIVLIYFCLLHLFVCDKPKRYLGLNEVEPKSALSVKLLSLAEAEIHFGASIVNTSNKQAHTSTSFSVPGAATVLLEDRSVAATLHTPYICCKCLRGRTNVWRVWETVQEVVGHMPVPKVPLVVSCWDKIFVVYKSLGICRSLLWQLSEIM